MKVFVSYSHADARLREEFIAHLAAIARQGLIDTWYDCRLSVGDSFLKKITTELDSSDIVILLISADFLNSDFCYGTEMRIAIKRHEEGKARIIPVILRACDWRATPFGGLVAAPHDGKPITSWLNRDEAFFDVVHSIRQAVEARLSAQDFDLNATPRRVDRKMPHESGCLSLVALSETIAYSNFEPHEYGKIITGSVAKILGVESSADSYADYIVGSLMGKLIEDGGFYRTNYNARIILQRPPNGHVLFDSKYILADERYSFVLVDQLKTRAYRMRLRSEWTINRDYLVDLIDGGYVNASLIINGRHEVDARNLLIDRSSDIVDGKTIDKDGISIRYNGIDLVIEILREIAPVSKKTFIEYRSISNMEENDHNFVVANMDPIFGADYSFRLAHGLENYRMHAPTIGPSFYMRSSMGNVAVDMIPPSLVEVHVPGWIVPGIFGVFNWSVAQ